MSSNSPSSCPVIACSADERYAMPLAVMLKSLELNLRETPRVRIMILDGGLTRKTRERVVRVLNTGRLDITWLRPEVEKLKDLPVFGHIQLSAYFRLLIPDLLPETVGRVLYLDVDMVILRDIGGLWACDPGNLPLLAVRQGTTTLQGLPFWRELGLTPSSKYLNSGVLAMNLMAWREGKLGQKVINVLTRFSSQIRFWDQDGINAVLADQWGELNPEWNVTVDCFVPDGQAVPVGEKPEELRARAAIVHFASATKPWAYFVDHPAKALFYEYLDQTDWKGWRPRPPWRVYLNRYYWSRMLHRGPAKNCQTGLI
jgi:lipopolysaccharide biosynthesis glycosyltransferase